MTDKVFLLRKIGDIYKIGDKATHFLGCPFDRKTQQPNLNKARTFKTSAGARATNAFKYDGYEVIEAEVVIRLKENA